MKTLHLTNSWHSTSGGISTFYRALMKAAGERGQQIRLIVPGERDGLEDCSEFAKIYYVKAPPAPFNSRYRILYPAQFVGRASAVQKIVAAERPDLLEICDKYTLNYFGGLARAGLARALPDAPLVVGLSCERMDDNFSAYVGSPPFARRLCAAYVKWLYFPLFDHHIANSEYTAEELQIASRGDTLGRKICVRPMGVDLGHFSPSRKSLQARRILERACGGSSESVLLVYAGRLVPEKNLPLLFEVFAALVRSGRRDYRLVVAGDGIERGQWERYCAQRAPGSVFFAGHVKNVEQLSDLLANADAFVHPNHREPFGIAPLEAMASGLPLVAPDRGGVASYANEENAWTAAPTLESFQLAIEARLADQPEADRRARNALETAGRFCWESAAGAFLDLYAELYRWPRPRPAPWFA